MAIIKLVTVLAVGLIHEMAVANALPNDANIWKVETPSHNKEAHVELVYENYSENMLPVLSRDLTLLEQAVETIGNDACKNQCKSMIAGIHNLTSWAVRFYDASGKFPEGVLSGSLYQLGNFDECLEIGRVDDAPTGVHGQYCLAEVGIRVPNFYFNRTGTIWDKFKPSTERIRHQITKLRWGICVPAACEPQDVENVLQTVLNVAFSGSRLKLISRIPDNSCHKNTTEFYNNLDIGYTCIILFLIFFLVVGTAFHTTYLIRNEKVPGDLLSQILIGFSAIMNVKKLCSSERSGENYHCIAGIKTTAMLIIIMGHSLIHMVSGPVMNLGSWQDGLTKVGNSIFLNSPLLVDTFLLISGFLVSCSILKELHKGRKINFIHVYVLRYIRLTPAYFVVVGFYMTWFVRMDSGPTWSRIFVERDRCLASWWTNLLYVNNYINTDKLCMFQSWYLAVDTQLFILAPLVIYPLHKWPRIGKLILAAVTALSVTIPFVITIRNHSDPTLMVYSAEIEDISTNSFFVTSYIKTHMRATSYCIGIICGYIVHRMNLSDYKFSRNTVRLGWLLASLFLVSSMFTVVLFYGPRKNFTPIESALYVASHRMLWSLGTGWVLLACLTGNGGFVANILQWRPFIPLSRLTYSVYLVNGIVILHSVGSLRTPDYLSNLNSYQNCIVHVIMTLMGALILSVICESPMLRLEKVFRPRAPQGSTKTKPVGTDDNGASNSIEA